MAPDVRHMTDQQRRWWFANHPEYSGTRRKGKATPVLPKRSGNPAGDRESYEKDRKSMDGISHYTDYADQRLQTTRKTDLAPEPDPITALDVLPYRRRLTSPIQFLRGLATNKAGGYVLNAAKRSKSKGPGEWVEVVRHLGIEHQSLKSGQPIVERAEKGIFENTRSMASNLMTIETECSMNIRAVKAS